MERMTKNLMLALSEQSEPLIAALPQQERVEILQIQARVAGLKRAIVWRYERLKAARTPSEFLDQAAQTPYPALLISLSEGLDADEAVTRYGPERLAELLGVSLKGAGAK